MKLQDKYLIQNPELTEAIGEMQILRNRKVLLVWKAE